MLKHVFLATALTCFAASSQALTLTATWDTAFPDPVGAGSTGVNTGTAFTVMFDDDNSNGLFDIAEQDSFSGIFVQSFAGDPGQSYDLLNQVVAIAGVTADSGLLGNTGWVFGQTGSSTVRTIVPGAFTYNTVDDGDSSVIPVPAALPLLASAIGVFGYAANRRRQTA